MCIMILSLVTRKDCTEPTSTRNARNKMKSYPIKTTPFLSEVLTAVGFSLTAWLYYITFRRVRQSKTAVFFAVFAARAVRWRFQFTDLRYENFKIFFYALDFTGGFVSKRGRSAVAKLLYQPLSATLPRPIGSSEPAVSFPSFFWRHCRRQRAILLRAYRLFTYL